MKVAKGHEGTEQVGRYRITEMITEAGGKPKLIIDDWKVAKDPHKRVAKFTGRTFFCKELEDVAKLSAISTWGGRN